VDPFTGIGQAADQAQAAASAAENARHRAILARLDNLPFGPFHRRLLILSGFGWLFDAMDVLLVGSIVAAVGASWKLTSGQVGEIISANLLGLFFGAILAGPLSDKLGRRGVYQITLLAYSIFTGLSALAFNQLSLMIIRFLAGLGLGGELPVASTLVSEFAPARKRGLMLVLLESFWGYGAVLAALIGYLVIPRFGWQAAFLIGALPALYVFILRRALPESPRFLLSQGREAEATAIIDRAVLESGGNLEAESPATSPEPGRNSPAQAARKIGLKDLFGSLYRRRTVMLWLLWFAMVFSYYGIFTWLPSLLRGKGFSLEEAFLLNLLISLAQIPGYFTAAFLVERWGRKPTLLVFLVCCAVTAFFFGSTGLNSGGPVTVAPVLIWGGLTAFFNLGAWGIVYTYTPEQYPTAARGTGSGFATAFGRFGGVLAPLVVGSLLDLTGQSTLVVFIIFAALMLVGAASVFILGVETRGKTLEELEVAA
jgi:MFS transporter, putative metabolite:H+ symporter